LNIAFKYEKMLYSTIIFVNLEHVKCAGILMNFELNKQFFAENEDNMNFEKFAIILVNFIHD
jgi:hypothetical protein